MLLFIATIVKSLFYMLNPDSINLYLLRNFRFPVALIRISLHAHNTDGSFAAKVSQPLDCLLLDRSEAAEDVALPQVADAGCRKPAHHSVAVEDWNPAVWTSCPPVQRKKKPKV